jgi:hypothetical protein
MGDRVEIFYAVKCCPTLPVLHLLSLLGVSFDCASTAEFQPHRAFPPQADSLVHCRQVGREEGRLVALTAHVGERARGDDLVDEPRPSAHELIRVLDPAASDRYAPSHTLAPAPDASVAIRGGRVEDSDQLVS